MTEKDFAAVPDVDIDSGVFKYVYIREYQADVYDKTESELTSAGLDCECLGGGRIEHRPDKKYIKVYGYSMGFGKANHQKSVKILKTKYSDYEIVWSDEGY